mmetsp:Transcript_17340/g.54504  ORF Transcript_17340/g.54504 Transcript_17340/m.54504 type:complete len:92 (+) Transcript_17340:288-563(+)
MRACMREARVCSVTRGSQTGLPGMHHLFRSGDLQERRRAARMTQYGWLTTPLELFSFRMAAVATPTTGANTNKGLSKRDFSRPGFMPWATS